MCRRARQSDSKTRTREHTEDLLPHSPNTLNMFLIRKRLSYGEKGRVHLQRSANALETILAWFWILRTSCRILCLPLPFPLYTGWNPWTLAWVGPRDFDWSMTEHSASQREGSSPSHWEVGDLRKES